MKIFLLTIGIALVSLFAIQWFQSSRVLKQEDQAGPDTKLQKIRIGEAELSVEVVKTSSAITLGLGERDILGSDGMLFVMPSRDIPSFWMKGMRFDLDFVWIDGSSVVDITENVPAQPEVSMDQLRTYSPRVPVTHVLELNAGEVQKRGIGFGDTVTFSY